MTTLQRYYLLAGLIALINLNDLARADVDLILHHGKIVTVDREFSIRAGTGRQGRPARSGSARTKTCSRRADPNTTVVDLAGKMVLPGLIDSHAHPTDACMTEFDHPIPEMETIADVLDYIRARAKAVGAGRWIVVRQVFITRLKEQRYPTRDELDQVAPREPGALRDRARRLAQLAGAEAQRHRQGFPHRRAGQDREGPANRRADRHPAQLHALRQSGAVRAEADRARPRAPADRTLRAITTRSASRRSSIATPTRRRSHRYQKLHDGRALSRAHRHLAPHRDARRPSTRSSKRSAGWPHIRFVKGGPRLRIVGIKTYLDGGMLTGSAYMREPWGVSKIYSIDDPSYRGVLFIPRERLVPIVQTRPSQSGLQFTAHTVGDGAVHTLLDAYEEVEQDIHALLRRGRASRTPIS